MSDISIKCIADGIPMPFSKGRKIFFLKNDSFENVNAPCSITITPAFIIEFLKFNKLNDPIDPSEINLKLSITDGFLFPSHQFNALQSSYLKLSENKTKELSSRLVYNSNVYQAGSEVMIKEICEDGISDFESLLYKIKYYIKKVHKELDTLTNVKDNDYVPSIVVYQSTATLHINSGVATSMQLESRFKNVVEVSAVRGEVRSLFFGQASADEYIISKTQNINHKGYILKRKAAIKKGILNKYSDFGYSKANTEKKNRFVLQDAEISQIATGIQEIEQYLGFPIEVEWAKDRLNKKIYFTKVAKITTQAEIKWPTEIPFKKKPTYLLGTGRSVGIGRVSGYAKKITHSFDEQQISPKDILILEYADVKWLNMVHKVAGIICFQGSSCSWLAKKARMLEVPMVVEATPELKYIASGDPIIIDLYEGLLAKVYNGLLNQEQVPPKSLLPLSISSKIGLNVNHAEQAFHSADRFPHLNNVIVNLGNIIKEEICVHPMFFVEETKALPAQNGLINESIYNYRNCKEYYVESIRQSVSLIAHAFFPRPITIILSDLSTTEYSELMLGGNYEFEEQNPMLGLRGTSRFIHPIYQKVFEEECTALRLVLDQLYGQEMRIMLPYCRTTEEVTKVQFLMAQFGLERSVGLKMDMLIWNAANIFDIENYLPYFDGICIDQTVLEQMTIGIDFESPVLRQNDLFPNKALKSLIDLLFKKTKLSQKRIGMCNIKRQDDISDLLSNNPCVQSVMLHAKQFIQIQKQLGHCNKMEKYLECMIRPLNQEISNSYE